MAAAVAIASANKHGLLYNYALNLYEMVRN